MANYKILPSMGFQTLDPLNVRSESFSTHIINVVLVVCDPYYYIDENMSQIVDTISSF